MSESEVHCPSCGSADTMRTRLLGVEDEETHEQAAAVPVQDDTWSCLRCDHSFTPFPCPACGSYEIDGARGVSGADYLRPLAVVSCRRCQEVFAPHTSVA
ncbi:hypothetical protein [Micromonospora sp. DT227]|uniref:hypothetical protein n=1 Tax=Micromonospora sp. DT227 TaxID=3393433 RepID=UPI003CECFE8D